MVRQIDLSWRWVIGFCGSQIFKIIGWSFHHFSLLMLDQCKDTKFICNANMFYLELFKKCYQWNNVTREYTVFTIWIVCVSKNIKLAYLADMWNQLAAPSGFLFLKNAIIFYRAPVRLLPEKKLHCKVALFCASDSLKLKHEVGGVGDFE